MMTSADLSELEDGIVNAAVSLLAYGPHGLQSLESALRRIRLIEEAQEVIVRADVPQLLVG